MFDYVNFDDQTWPDLDAALSQFIHGAFADLPLDRILRAWEDVYGAERIAQWKQASQSGTGEGLAGIPG